jgi:hypothetical protein
VGTGCFGVYKKGKNNKAFSKLSKRKINFAWSSLAFQFCPQMTYLTLTWGIFTICRIGCLCLHNINFLTEKFYEK